MKLILAVLILFSVGATPAHAVFHDDEAAAGAAPEEDLEFLAENNPGNENTESSKLGGHHRNLLTPSWGVFENNYFGPRKYLEVKSCTNGATIKTSSQVLKDRNEYDFTQQWRYKDGYIESRKCPGMVVDIPRSSCKRGTKIHLWQKTGGNNQKWLISEGGNTVTFRSKNCGGSNMMLDQAWDDQNKIHIWNRNSELWSSDGGRSQIWTWRPKT